MVSYIKGGKRAKGIWKQDSEVNFWAQEGTTLSKKYSTLFFFDNLEDFNEARLHEATFNLHTHDWNFPACQ